jgi:hypothetical protein
MRRINNPVNASLLMKQIRKQRLYSSEDDSRSLTDVGVWTKLFGMSLQNYMVMHDFESKVENRHNYGLVLFIINCVMVDLYFLARLFKQPCLDSAGQAVAGCQTVWPSLCLLYLGDNHIRNIRLLLTDDDSPILFYHTKNRIDNFRGVEYLNQKGVDPQVGDPFRCLNFQSLQLSIDLDRVMRDWRTNFDFFQRETMSASFGRMRKTVRKTRKPVRKSMKKSKKLVKKSRKTVRKSRKSVKKSSQSVRKKNSK